MTNFAGENAMYNCGNCGLELIAEEVCSVDAGRNCANGEFAPCPNCGEENSIDRDNDDE